VSIDATFERLNVHSPLESFERRDWTPDTDRDAASGVTSHGKKPHVCFVAPTTWPGAHRQLRHQGRGRRRGAAEHDHAGAGEARLQGLDDLARLRPAAPVEVQGITVHKMYKPDEGIPVLRFLHPRLTSLWSALKRVDADVYYQRTAAINTAVMAEFCKRHGKKSIYAGASDVDFIPGQEDIRYARDRRIFQHGVRRVDKVITQNAAQAKTLLDNYGRESTVIQSCYVPKPGARADRQGYVLWVASVRPSKRVELMLEIARRLPNHPFVVIGGPDPGRKDIEYFESVKAIARTLPNVKLMGFMPFAEAESCFNGARVFVNTSLYEGFPTRSCRRGRAASRRWASWTPARAATASPSTTS
jgi:glycosyltransferase involved in cell wall biosynthesis